MKYSKKPVVIDAWQFDPSLPPTEIPEWILPEWFHEEIVPVAAFIERVVRRTERRGSPVVMIPTLGGVIRANIGDYIIKGVKGEVYPCTPDIFEATYERVPDAQDVDSNQDKG